jgi:hypothetical protein
MQEYFHLAEDISIEMANIVFDKAVQKVIKSHQTHPPHLYRLVLLTTAEIFVVFNGKLLSYNSICCTTYR